MNETSSSSNQWSISHETISQRAEAIWRSYGTPQGRDEEIWLEAERQLQGEQKQSSPSSENVPTNAPAPTPRAGTTPPVQPSRPIASKESELMEKNASTVPSRAKSRSGKSR